jgi:hypothetical protein
LDYPQDEFLPPPPPTGPLPVTDWQTSPDATACRSQSAASSRHRKRLAVMPMPLLRRVEAVDMPYIEQEYPRELAYRLAHSGKVIGLDATSAPPEPSYYPLPQSPDSRLYAPLNDLQIRQLADRHNAQLLLVGRLLDLSFERETAHIGQVISAEKSFQELKRGLFQAWRDSYWRRFQVEVSLYDGASGALLNRGRFGGEAEHRVTPSLAPGFGSRGFWRSDYGVLLDKLLTEQVAAIEQAVTCIPLRATVVKVSGNRLEINAGQDAGLQLGDRFALFRRAPAGRDASGQLSYRWQRVSNIALTGVFPLKSTTELHLKEPVHSVKVGDMLQAY